MNHLDKKYIDFQLDWRKKYIEALEDKLQFLNSAIGIIAVQPKEVFESVLSIRTAHEFHGYRIESLELKHKLYHEREALAQWVLHKDNFNQTEQNDKKDFEENFKNVVNFIWRVTNAPNNLSEAGRNRLKSLYSRYEGTNKNDLPELQKIFLTMKQALEQLKIEWK